jgi:hypothetical protein
LRALRVFDASRTRVMVFLRDDVFDQVTSGDEGFTNLDHVLARHRALLGWSQEDVLTLIVKRFFADARVASRFDVDPARLSDPEARAHAFSKLFPATMSAQKQPRATLRWIYLNLADGNGVVTPRDVVDLLQHARQRQQNDYQQRPDGESDQLIGAAALRHGYEEVSKQKRRAILRAELPNLWPHIEKFVGLKTEWDDESLSALLGDDAKWVVPALVHVGVLARSGANYRFPPLYKPGLELVQGHQRVADLRRH